MRRKTLWLAFFGLLAWTLAGCASSASERELIRELEARVTTLEERR